MMPMQRGGCWRWPWCLKDISGAKPASSAAWTVPARLGSTLQRRRHRRALQPHSGWTETTAHSRAGGDSSRAGSQRTRPCQTWRGALAPGGFGPRDQDAVQCDLGRAQRRRDAAPPRLSAAVGGTATSPTGSCGAGGAQKNFADLVKAAIPEHAREKPIELWWQDEARVGQQGTLTRVWAERGGRPPAPRDQRREWAYIFGALCPRRETGAALVLPYANAYAMNLHLKEISSQVMQGSHATVGSIRHARDDARIGIETGAMPLRGILGVRVGETTTVEHRLNPVVSKDMGLRFEHRQHKRSNNRAADPVSTVELANVGVGRAHRSYRAERESGIPRPTPAPHDD